MKRLCFDKASRECCFIFLFLFKVRNAIEKEGFLNFQMHLKRYNEVTVKYMLAFQKKQLFLVI